VGRMGGDEIVVGVGVVLRSAGGGFWVGSADDEMSGAEEAAFE